LVERSNFLTEWQALPSATYPSGTPTTMAIRASMTLGLTNLEVILIVLSRCWLLVFSGWTSPAIKQYNDQGPCTGVDVNYYPWVSGQNKE
jgi:hypothetical protein